MFFLLYNYFGDIMKIGIASDHRGVEKKEKIINYLKKKYDIKDYGTNSLESVDYPKYAFSIGEDVGDRKIDFGILLCGTGIGMSIACNKVKGVRCAKVDSVSDAFYARSHNNANVISFSSDLSFFKMKKIINKYLETSFSSLEKHQRRNDMVDNYVIKL